MDSNLKTMTPDEKEMLAEILHKQVFDHPGASKPVTTSSRAVLASRRSFPSQTSETLPSSNSLTDNSSTAPSLPKTALKTALYQYRIEGIQRNASDNLKSIIRNLEHCLNSQDLTTDSFFDVVVQRVKLGSYTNPKASKSFKLSQLEEGSIMQYLAMACPDPSKGEIHQVTIESFLTSLRRASRTHYRLKLSESHKNTVVHFSNILTNNGTDLQGLFNYVERGEKGILSDDVELSPEQIEVAAKFIDGMGDGDGEVSLQELRHAFRAARTMVAQIDPDRRGRNKTERLAKAMKTLNITAEDFFNDVLNDANGGVKSSTQGEGAEEEEASIGQITLFKALSKLSRSVADLNPELEGFPFSDDDVLEIMDYLDPNKDGQVTLEEIKDGLRRVREGPGADSESGSAARLLKVLEAAMIEEGADLKNVFEDIDADGSGSVNTHELGEAIGGFHKRRLKRKQEAFRKSEERGKRKLGRERKTRSEVLESIEKWINDHNINSMDVSSRDIGVFVNFLDPFNDGEIKAEEANGFLEYIKGGARVDHEHEFKAARLLSRCGQSMFVRRKGVWDLWDKGKRIEKEALMDGYEDDFNNEEGEEKKEGEDNGHLSRNRNQSISLTQDDFKEDYKEFQVYNETLGVNVVVRAIGEIVGAEVDRGDRKKSSYRAGLRGGPKKVEEEKSSTKGMCESKLEISKHTLGTAITNVMTAANEPVEIFTPSDIVATEMFFNQNPYDVKNQAMVKDWKNSISKEEFMYGFEIAKLGRDESKAEEIALAKKVEDVMEEMGWTFNSSFDACKKVQVNDVKTKSASTTGRKLAVKQSTHAEVIIKDWIDVCHESPDDQDTQGQQTAARRNFETMKAHKLTRIARSGVDEDAAVGRKTRAGRCEGHDGMKELILKGIRLAKTGVRISIRQGVWDRANDNTFHGKGWRNVYTGEAKDVNFADIVEGLEGDEEEDRENIKITCYTIRCELITVKGRREQMVVSSYTPYVPPPPTPVVFETGVDSASMLIPRVNTETLKDSLGRKRVSIELRVEIQKGRDWREGKCRNLANTVSLLTGGGKKGFRAVKSLMYSGSLGEGNRIKCKITDLQPASWYHCRYRVKFKTLEYELTDEERYDSHDEDAGDVPGVHFSGKGSSISGLSSCATKPTVPTPPASPHFILSTTERVLPMGGSKTKQGIRVVWDEARDNGYQIKTYVVQMKEWREEVKGEEEWGIGGRASAGWGVYKTVYQNQFRQYFVQPCSPFVTKIKFRVAAVNVLGMGPWGDEAVLAGERYSDFFKSNWEQAGVAERAAATFEPDDTVEEKVTGGDIRKRLEREQQGKVIAFGRKVSDNFGLFGGGKSRGRSSGRLWGMTSPTRPSTTLPALRGNVDVRTLQLVRNAEVIKEQETDFPVSLEAAMEAMRRVGGGTTIKRPKLMDPRASPSPINYLTKVRREREEGRRPMTAPPRAMQGELTAKWEVDGGMEASVTGVGSSVAS